MSDLTPTEGNQIIAADIVDGQLVFKRHDGTEEHFTIGSGGAKFTAESPEIFYDEPDGGGGDPEYAYPTWIVEHNLDTEIPQVTVWVNVAGATNQPAPAGGELPDPTWMELSQAAFIQVFSNDGWQSVAAYFSVVIVDNNTVKLIATNNDVLGTSAVPEGKFRIAVS